MPPVSYSATCHSKGALLRDTSQAFSKAKLVLCKDSIGSEKSISLRFSRRSYTSFMIKGSGQSVLKCRKNTDPKCLCIKP